jgi:hypothetical protein
MLEFLQDGEWQEVFKYGTPTHCPGGPALKINGGASEISFEAHNHQHPKSIPFATHKVGLQPFTREDVKQILSLAWGENDGPNWLMTGQLNDGRFFKISAGCDYTGWG